MRVECLMKTMISLPASGRVACSEISHVVIKLTPQ